MNYLSVCSGIEAASQAWHPLGWKAVAFSEIESFPRDVLDYHYPETPNWGDMTKYEDWPDANINVLCGGTPCQSFSVAGLRKGLDDQRGNLMLTFGAIAAKYRPEWLVWENVPGVLSSGEGRDFAAFLGLLTGQQVTPPAKGWSNSGILAGISSAYGLAWRVLDAQYAGVPQRRRRVFVVGYLGDWRRAAAVLFERHSLSGDPAPSRKARQDIAGTISSRTTGGGGLGTDFELGGGLIPDVSPTLISGPATKASHGKKSGTDREALIAMPHASISPAIKARDYKGASSDGDGDGDGAILVPMVCPTLRAGGNKTGGDRPPGTDVDTADSLIVTHSLRGEGFDASEDGTGRGTPLVPVAYSTKLHNTTSNQAGKFYEEYTPSLDANSPPPAVAFQSSQSGVRLDDVHATLDSNNGSRRHNGVPAFDTTQVTSKDNRSNPQPGDPCHPLAAGAHAPAIAFDCKASGQNGFGIGEIAGTQRAMGHAGSHTNGGGHQAVMTGMSVRRLTPLECERLMGCKDGYTAIPRKGKVAADGPRYKSLGNSWAIPDVRWIGERIMAVEAIP